MATIITAEEIKRSIERVRENQRSRAERIANCEVEDTDCYMSIMSDRAALDVYERQLEILEDGGYAWFDEYATLDGELVDARWVETRYGVKLVADMPNGETVWTTATTDKGLAKRGLRKVRVKRAAWADFGGGQWAKVYAAKWNRATGEEVEGPVEIEW